MRCRVQQSSETSEGQHIKSVLGCHGEPSGQASSKEVWTVQSPSPGGGNARGHSCQPLQDKSPSEGATMPQAPSRHQTSAAGAASPFQRGPRVSCVGRLCIEHHKHHDRSGGWLLSPKPAWDSRGRRHGAPFLLQRPGFGVSRQCMGHDESPGRVVAYENLREPMLEAEGPKPRPQTHTGGPASAFAVRRRSPETKSRAERAQ
jgi:hypothetical protein